MKIYLGILLMGMMCVGCARSGSLPSDTLNCENGTLVLFKASDNCVFNILEAPDQCPVGVPFQYELSTHRVCSSDPVLSRSASVAIRDEALRAQPEEGALLDLSGEQTSTVPVTPSSEAPPTQPSEPDSGLRDEVFEE
ncbi:MAG: hypothetical protein VX589_16470 [Myxococcota bacterium]|nr:hypothetical protein [Myxococcota bacterium]